MKTILLAALTLALLVPTAADDAKTTTARVRLLHAIVGAPAADLYCDGKKVAENLTFKTLTGYFEVESGKTTLKFTAAGKNATLFEGTATFSRGAEYTIAPFGTMDKVRLTVQNDATSKSDDKKARVRVFNLSLGAPSLDFVFFTRRAAEGEAIKKVDYGEDSTKLVEPGEAILQVFSGGQTYKETPVFTLEAGKKYAFFAVGKPGIPGPQAFDVLIFGP